MYSKPRCCLFTSATGRVGVHTALKYEAKPVRYVMQRFRGWSGAASLCPRNRAAITVLTCEQKPYVVWFSCGSKGRFCVNITLLIVKVTFQGLYIIPNYTNSDGNIKTCQCLQVFSKAAPGLSHFAAFLLSVYHKLPFLCSPLILLLPVTNLR